jgi:hypothetical protein
LQFTAAQLFPRLLGTLLDNSAPLDVRCRRPTSVAERFKLLYVLGHGASHGDPTFRSLFLVWIEQVFNSLSLELQLSVCSMVSELCRADRSPVCQRLTLRVTELAGEEQPLLSLAASQAYFLDAFDIDVKLHPSTVTLWEQNLTVDDARLLFYLLCETEQNVLSLDLSKNRLAALPREISLLQSVTWLSLSSNNLRSIPASIGELTALKKLVLSGNMVSLLPPTFGRLNSLKELDLSSNRLLSLPLEIGMLSALVELNLAHNKLCELPLEFSRLTSLSKSTFALVQH